MTNAYTQRKDAKNSFLYPLEGYAKVAKKNNMGERALDLCAGHWTSCRWLQGSRPLEFSQPFIFIPHFFATFALFAPLRWV